MSDFDPGKHWWDYDPDELHSILEAFCEKYDPIAARSFLKSQHTLIRLNIHRPFFCSLKPGNWSLEDYAEMLGIDKGTLSRYFEGKSCPGDEIVYQWLRMEGLDYKDLPEAPKTGAYILVPFIQAACRVLVDRESSRLPEKLQRQLTPLPDFRLVDSAILFTLIQPGRVCEQWRDLWHHTRGNPLEHSDDLITVNFLTLLKRETEEFLGLTPIPASEVQNSGNSIGDLESPEARTAFLSRICNLWDFPTQHAAMGTYEILCPLMSGAF